MRGKGASVFEGSFLLSIVTAFTATIFAGDRAQIKHVGKRYYLRATASSSALLLPLYAARQAAQWIRDQLPLAPQ